MLPAIKTRYRFERFAFGERVGGPPCFGYGADAAPSVKQVEYNACVAPIDKFHLAIEDSISVDPQTLMQLASTCIRKLTNMAAHGTKALPA